MALNTAIPYHLAVVMDGNGRWANKRFLPRLAGHKQGLEALKKLIAGCLDRKISVLTVFAFSSENWKRPVDEVSGLMDILVGALAREVAHLQSEGVRLHFVGARHAFTQKIQNAFNTAEQATAANTRLIFNVCFNFGGRWDIVTAAAQLAARGEAITEESLSAALALAHCPDPDLVIRTGGEKRMSNFLLWQSAYAELCFCDVLWPDFDAVALDAALADYASRERRYGQISAQVGSSKGTNVC